MKKTVTFLTVTASLLMPATAMSGAVASKASSKAKQRFEQVTQRRARHWSSHCRIPASGAARCSSTVKNGNITCNYRIRIADRGAGRARITAEQCVL